MLDLMVLRAYLAHFRKRLRCVRYGHDPVLVLTGPGGVVSLGGAVALDAMEREGSEQEAQILKILGEPIVKKWACARCGATEGKGIQPPRLT